MTVNGAGTTRCLAVPGLALLFLMAPLGSARSQATPVGPQAQLSFRSLPDLRAANVECGRPPRLISLSPFVLPDGVLWRMSAPPEATRPVGAAQAIREALSQSLASLKAGDVEGYVSVFAPDYEQSGPSGPPQTRADALSAAQADLAAHRYTEADFTLSDLRLVTPTEAAVTMTRRVVTVTKNTPPTVYPTPDGSSYVQSNTVTVQKITVFHQTWARRGAGWVLVRSQAVDGVTTAVA